MAEKILVVDDEREIADLMALYLKNEGYETLVCYGGAEALGQIQAGPVDLAILDVMLPEISGFELCRRIRERYQYPVIMLTAKGEELDKINGLSLGADDYVTKPFLPLELVARVKAQLRRYKRYNGEAPRKEPLTCGGLVIDVENHQASLNGAPLSLTPTEFSLLAALCEARARWSPRRSCSAGSGGRLLHQGQQHHHRAHPASSGKAGGFLRAPQIHQNRVGGWL